MRFIFIAKCYTWEVPVFKYIKIHIQFEFDYRKFYTPLLNKFSIYTYVHRQYTNSYKINMIKDQGLLRMGHGIGVNLPIYSWAKVQRYTDLSLLSTDE